VHSWHVAMASNVETDGQIQERLEGEESKTDLEERGRLL